MTRAVLGAMMLCLAGCSALAVLRPSGAGLDEADRLAVQGDYAGAVTLYDDFLLRNPDDASAPRARAGRETATAVLSIRAELGRVREQLVAREAEIKRLRDQLAASDQAVTTQKGEVTRLSQELATRHADLQRLTAEAEKLRTDLESLKRIDLRLERRR